MTLGEFSAGYYSLHLVRKGASRYDWFDRTGQSNIVAIFSGFERVRTDLEGLVKMARRWQHEGWTDQAKPLPKTYFPPQVEARVPYFWSLLPSSWDQSAVSFTLERDGPVHLVVLPDKDVTVTGIRIDRVHF
jgi:hypothetical protein